MERISEIPKREGTKPYIVTGKPLSARERETLFYTALGLTHKQIADKMDISDQTVKNHRSNAYIKMGVFSGVEAIVLLILTDQGFYYKVQKAILGGNNGR